jgi:hypothetical protein
MQRRARTHSMRTCAAAPLHAQSAFEIRQRCTGWQVHGKSAGAPRGPIALAASIVRRDGLFGLYRGLGITIIRDTPSTGLYYLAYEVRSGWQGARLSGCDF